MLRPTAACRSAARASSSRSHSVKALAVVQQQQQQPRPAAAVCSRAAAATAASVVAAALLLGGPSTAFAEEAEQLPEPLFPGFNDPQKAKLKAAEENFQGSDTLKKVGASGDAESLRACVIAS